MLSKVFGRESITCISLKENLGFGKANNIGAKYAKGDYLFFLNPDTILINDAINILFDFMRDNQDCGACGGNLFDANMKENHSYSRLAPSILKEIDLASKRIISKFLFGKDAEFNHQDIPLEVAYITGADLMVSVVAWNKCGGFDPAFFMYYEESDLQLKIRNLNYRIFNIPGSHIIHLEGQSFHLNLDREKRILDGRFVYFEKNYGLIYNFVSNLINIFLYSVATIICVCFSNPDRHKKYYLRLSVFFHKLI